MGLWYNNFTKIEIISVIKKPKTVYKSTTPISNFLRKIKGFVRANLKLATLVFSLFLYLLPQLAFADKADYYDRIWLVGENDSFLSQNKTIPSDWGIFKCGIENAHNLGLKWVRAFQTDRELGTNNLHGSTGGDLHFGKKDEPLFKAYFYFWIAPEAKTALNDEQKKYIEACDKLVKNNALQLHIQVRISPNFGSTVFANETEKVVYYKRPGEYGFSFAVPYSDSVPLEKRYDNSKIDIWAILSMTNSDPKKKNGLDQAFLTEEWDTIGTITGDTTAIDNDNWKKNNIGANEHAPDGGDSTNLQPTADKITDRLDGGADAGKSVTETLLGWIAKFIGYVIYIINSIIYFIFYLFIVPILSALLSVHPWTDNFVNIIYPGWLIMRNLANVAFIVSLLVVGLRILFLQETVAATRTFIKNLLIMGLLVNFSLVIAQGAVAIADTVQSQFLPKNSQVIQALGWKLMAEPAQRFNNRPNEEAVGVGTALANIYMPIVLLVLCVSSFFAFVAIVAFIVIRLGALWVLYMVSPIAYYGAVLGTSLGSSIPQSGNLSKQWWSNFIKYTISVPILAFFMNMTALVAITFTTRDGTSILVGGDSKSTFGAGQAIADTLVQAELTVMTHYIVLLFLFLGMKYAAASGIWGADKVISFAKKGKEKTLEAIGGAAKNLGLGAKNLVGDKAAGALEAKGRTNLAALTRGLFRPKMTADVAKEKLKKEYKKRISGPANTRALEAERAQRRFFGMDNKANTKGWNRRAKDEELNDKTTTDLKGMLGDAMNSRDFELAGAVARQMLNNGEHESLIEAVEDVTGAHYARNRAGLNAALDALTRASNMSTADSNTLKDQARASARKQNHLRPYR